MDPVTNKDDPVGEQQDSETQRRSGAMSPLTRRDTVRENSPGIGCTVFGRLQGR